jgi:hypothetical protein
MSTLLGKSAEFDFYTIEHPDYGNRIGIDKALDTIRTAKVAGVFEVAGSWLKHEVFPKGKVQSVADARKFLDKNPEAFDVIRDGVMKVMIQQQLEAEGSTNGSAGND